MSVKLFIICGHGAGDSGAVGGGYTEADLVRQLASRIKARGGSAVQVGDTSVNWYASNYIGKGKCPKGVPVVELHMDSAAASARGGHVIIKAGFEPDAYDRALEGFIKGFFPGRSVTMSKRSDLANPNRAANMGVNYRLVENGFISNDADRRKFIEHMDELADGYLAAFGIKSNGSGAGSSSSKPSGGSQASGGKIAVDGCWGPKTTLLAQQVCGTPADGVVSSQDQCWRSRMPGCTGGWEWVGSAVGSQLVIALQRKWGVAADGIMGPDTINAMIRYYMARGSGATVCDGRLDGPSLTIKQFQRELNAGRI